MEKVNQSHQEPVTYTLEPHPLSGTRQRAENLVSELPGDLSGATVVVDVSRMQSYAQCFIDELCKQILQVHQAESLRILHGNEILQSSVAYSAKLRNLTERVSFV